MRWSVDGRRPTTYARIYTALMWARRDKRAFEGAAHTLEVARRQQAKGDAPPTRWTRLSRRVRERDLAGMRAWVVSPRRVRPRARVLYLHGGGYVHPLTADYWRLVRALSADGAPAPAEVVVPAYPLAPDATIDEVLPRLLDAHRSLTASTPELPVVVMGDSAGGALTLVLAAALRDHGDHPHPAGLVLLSPWLDGTLDEDEVADLEASDPMLAESGLRAAAARWAGERDPADPLVSPVNGRLEGLAPIDVLVGAHDILRPAVDRLADLAHRDGARLQVHEVPAMFHVWMTRAIPEARRTRRQLAALVAARTREPGGARGFRSRSPGRRPGGTGGSPPPV